MNHKEIQVVMFPVKSLASKGAEKLVGAIDKFRCEFLLAGGGTLIELSQLPKIPPFLDVSCLKDIGPAGTNIPVATEDLFKKLFPNFKGTTNMYSMTEFGSLISYHDSSSKLGNVAPGTEVKIVDPETNEALGPNQVGEIHAKCDIITPGYLNRPEEDAKLFSGDGFINTGDLGHYDEEGLLYYDGRNKELIKSRGLHVHPVEIEEIIATHPEVKEAAVFGRDDEVRNDFQSPFQVK